MKNKNSFIVSFYFKNTPISGKLLVLNSALEEAVKRVDVNSSGKEIIACNMALVSVIGHTMKHPAIITSQIHSGEKYLISEFYDAYKIRTYAKLCDEKDFTLDDNSFLMLTVDWEKINKNRYQTIINPEKDINSIFENYYMKSQQLKIKTKSYFEEGCFSLLIIERNPYKEGSFHDDPWERAQIFLSTVTNDEMKLMVDNYTELLPKIFAEEEIILNNFTELRWQCKCSESRFKSILSQIDQNELKEFVTVNGIEIDCHYCGKKYNIK